MNRVNRIEQWTSVMAATTAEVSTTRSFDVIDGELTAAQLETFATTTPQSKTVHPTNDFKNITFINGQENSNFALKFTPRDYAEVGDTLLNVQEAKAAENQGIGDVLVESEMCLSGDSDEDDDVALRGEDISSSESYENWSFVTKSCDRYSATPPANKNETEAFLIAYHREEYLSNMISQQEFHSVAEITDFFDCNNVTFNSTVKPQPILRDESYQFEQMSSVVTEMKEQVVASPIENFRSNCLMANKRFRFHIVHSTSTNLLFDSIQMLPKSTSKRKLLVPWLVTDNFVSSPNSSAGSGFEGGLNTPVHTPNARLEVDKVDCQQQFYEDNSRVLSTVESDKVLCELETENYGEVSCNKFRSNKDIIRVDASAQGPLVEDSCIHANTSIAAPIDTLGRATNKQIFYGDNTLKKDSYVDFEASLNQASKQVLIGSLNNELGFLDPGPVEDHENVEDENQSAVKIDKRTQSLYSGCSYATSVSTISSKSNTIPPKQSYSIALSHQNRRGFGRFLSILRGGSKSSKQKHQPRPSKSVDFDVFGDRQNCASTYEYCSSGRSLLGRKFNRSSTLNKHHEDVDSMVEKLYSNFLNDTEFRLMILNFKSRAKYRKPKHGATIGGTMGDDRFNPLTDKTLSYSETIGLLKELYPQLKKMKGKHQKVVVNRVLRRHPHCKDDVNEVLLLDAFRLST